MVRYGSAGECGEECHTMAKACKDVLRRKSDAKLTAALQARKGVKALRELVCKKVCATPPPPLPEDRQSCARP